MPEPSQIIFSFKEVVTALIKEQGITEGIWGLHVRFGLKAMNIGASDEDLSPASIIPIVHLGLQKFDKVTSLSVDASVVNPPMKSIGAGATKAASKKKR